MQKKYNKKLSKSILSKITTYLQLSITNHPMIDPEKVVMKSYKSNVVNRIQVINARQGFKTALLHIKNLIAAEKKRLSFGKLAIAFNEFWAESARLSPNQDEKHKGILWSMIYRTALVEGEETAIGHLNETIKQKKAAVNKLNNEEEE